jgi:hypothetical protein
LRRPHALHPATLLIHENKQIIAARALTRVNSEPGDLIPCLTIAGKKNEPAGPDIAKERAFTGSQYRP